VIHESQGIGIAGAHIEIPDVLRRRGDVEVSGSWLLS